MKAEERKELEQNSLLRWINTGYQDIKTGPSRKAWYITGGVVLIAALLGGWYWYYTKQKTSNSEIWTQVDMARTPDALKKVTTDHPKTPQASAADLKLAFFFNDTATTEIYTTGEYTKARQALEEAIELFERVAGTYEKSAPLITQEAYLGIGKAKEALGAIDEAKTYYSKVIAKDEARENKNATSASVYATEAQTGIARIDTQGETLKKLNEELKTP